LINRSKRMIATLVFAGIALASCDRPSPNEVASHPRFTPSATVVTGSDGSSYTLLEGQLNTTTQSASAWIGPLGGVVTLVGLPKNGLPTAHALIVPPLAVLKNTLFTITLAGGSTVSVKLKAEQKNLLGQLVDVGKAGFKLPVTLVLSDAWATNLTDPLSVVILYDPENGQPMQPVPGIAVGGQLLVTGFLNHFSTYTAAQSSKYAAAMN
jgi:hypothetical protein